MDVWKGIVSERLVRAPLDQIGCGVQGDHRELETALQHCSPALFARLSTTRTGGLHPRAPGFAVWISYASHALAGAKTNLN